MTTRSKRFLAVAVVFLVLAITAFTARTKVGQAQSLVKETFVVACRAYYEGQDPNTGDLWERKVSHSGRSSFSRVSGTSMGPEAKTLTPVYSSARWTNFSSAKFLSTHGEFSRMDKILGLETYVLRGTDEGDAVERWFAPATGAVPLKIRITTQEGKTIIYEPISLVFTEVGEDEITN